MAEPQAEEAEPLTTSTRSMICAGIEKVSAKLFDRLLIETPSTNTWLKNEFAL